MIDIREICLLFLTCSKDSSKVSKKSYRYICHECNKIIGGNYDLYFGFDMVYCSIECREKYIIQNL